MCSISHGTNACLMGMDFSIFASRANLSVLKNQRISMTPASVAPFDCESYAGDFSLEILVVIARVSASAGCT